MKERCTIKNPGRGSGYRLPLASGEDIKIQTDRYANAAFGTLPDVIGKMEDIMELEKWNELLELPVERWPEYIKENRSA